MPGNEYKSLEHVESHVYFRPFWETNRSVDGFDPDTGFRWQHAVDLQIYENGEPTTPAAKLDNVPELGDYVMRKRVEARRLQLEVSTATSGWRVVGVQQILMPIDKAAGPANDYPTETRHQYSMRSPVFWVSRDSTSPDRNRANGNTCSGSHSGTTSGADGNSNSALDFGLGEGLSDTLTVYSGNMSWSTWVSGVAAYPVTLWTSPTSLGGTLNIRILEAGGTYFLSFNDGITGDQRALSWSGSGWVLLTVEKEGTQLRMYENGVPISAVPLANSAVGYGGATTWCDNSIMTAFDGRIYHRSVGGSALAYYYDDVINNSGNGGLLPINR